MEVPLVFATGAATESGHAYADVLGTAYEYPRRYRKLIRPGELFVYYRGRRVSGGGSQLPVYLGCGTVGTIKSGEDSDLLRCDIEDYQPFPDAVPFKNTDGRYLELGGTRRGYFQPGVRLIPLEVFETITGRGLDQYERPQMLARTTGYAASADALAIEAMSRAVVERDLLTQSDVISVVQMPTNNPGYDMRVSTNSGDLFVEVKGTRGRRARFFMTEGERLFSESHADRYLLAVVTGIDLANGTWTSINTLAGAATRARAGLSEHQWAGELESASLSEKVRGQHRA